MKRFTFIFAVMGLFVVANADSLRSQIEAMNKTMHTVFMKKDMNLFLKTVKGGTTKDFKYSEGGKAMTFDQMVAGMKMGFASMTKVESQSSKIIKLDEKPTTATCTTLQTLTAISVDDKKKTHKLGFKGTSIETFRKENGKWLMASMSWKDQTMTMDGKAMPMQAGG